MSTGRQAAADKESLPRQLKATRDFGFQVIKGEHVDEYAQAVSGTVAVAERLQRMRRLAKLGRMTDGIFESFDRSFRQSKLAWEFIDEMGKLGVHIWVERMCLSHATAKERMTAGIRFVVAQGERDELAERSMKRHFYARTNGVTLLMRPPIGFTFERVPEVKYRRLLPLEEDKALIAAVYDAVAGCGPMLAFEAPPVQALRAKYGALDTVVKLKALIRNPAYKGLNPIGHEAYATPYTERNRIVSDKLWDAANATCRHAPKKRTDSTLRDLVGTIGVEMTLESFLGRFITLCRHCLAPVHHGRVHVYRGMRRPTLECSGIPLDTADLQQAIQTYGYVRDEDIDKAIRAKGKTMRANSIPMVKHETEIVVAADIDGALATYLSCDTCGNRNIRKFSFDNLGATKRMVCKVCKAKKRVPTTPWKRPTYTPPDTTTIADFTDAASGYGTGSSDDSSASEATYFSKTASMAARRRAAAPSS